MLKIFEGTDEVLIFEVDEGGAGIGEEDFFEKGGRDREEYDVSLVELPIEITSRIRCEPNRVLTRECWIKR